MIFMEAHLREYYGKQIASFRATIREHIRLGNIHFDFVGGPPSVKIGVFSCVPAVLHMKGVIAGNILIYVLASGNYVGNAIRKSISVCSVHIMHSVGISDHLFSFERNRFSKATVRWPPNSEHTHTRAHKKHKNTRTTVWQSDYLFYQRYSTFWGAHGTSLMVSIESLIRMIIVVILLVLLSSSACIRWFVRCIFWKINASIFCTAYVH